jgi:hypothetical protein
MKGRKVKGFKPHPFYSKEGDYLTYFFQNVDSYSKRIDDTLTVFLSMGNDNFAGFKLKGIQRLLKAVEGELNVKVQDDDGLMLGLLIYAGFTEADSPTAYEYFARTATKVKGISIKRKLLEAACP